MPARLVSAVFHRSKGGERKNVRKITFSTRDSSYQRQESARNFAKAGTRNATRSGRRCRHEAEVHAFRSMEKTGRSRFDAQSVPVPVRSRRRPRPERSLGEPATTEGVHSRCLPAVRRRDPQCTRHHRLPEASESELERGLPRRVRAIIRRVFVQRPPARRICSGLSVACGGDARISAIRSSRSFGLNGLANR
jgi:hypothetical protein